MSTLQAGHPRRKKVSETASYMQDLCLVSSWDLTCGNRWKQHWREREMAYNKSQQNPQVVPGGTLELGWPYRVVPNWGRGWAFKPLGQPCGLPPGRKCHLEWDDIHQRPVSGKGLSCKPWIANSQQLGERVFGPHRRLWTACTTTCYPNKGDGLNYMWKSPKPNFLRIPKATGKKVKLRSNHLTDGLA